MYARHAKDSVRIPTKWYEISFKRIFTDSEWHRTRMPTARHPPLNTPSCPFK